MAEHLIQDTTLTGIADKIRSLLGLTGKMSPAQMQTNLTTEQANIAAALAALTEKGVEVPAGANSNALAGLIAAIETGAGMVLPPEITDFAVDAHTEKNYGVSSCVCGHSLGVKPTAAILISAEPRYVDSNDKSYIDACFAFGSGCVYISFNATGKFDGAVTYANLGSPSTSKRNSEREMTESKVTFIFGSKIYSQSFVLITMRW